MSASHVGDSVSELQQNLEDEVVQEILRSGTDLRQYSKQVESELQDAENRSIQDYIKESQNIASLHNQIAACDSILERMESMLMGFQSHLGSINTEMVELQQRSAQMSQQLSNRQAVRATLSQFIDDMTVSEDLIICILETPVTEAEFAVRLSELGHKMSFVKEQSFRESRSVVDVREALEHLRVKAVTKVRAFLLEQVYKLRKPMANYQVPQNNLLSKYKIFYEFLLGNERSVAQEVCVEYIETMGKVYYSYFKAYISRLMKLQYDENPSKEDLMGVDDNAPRGLFHTRTSLKNKGAVFSLGSRGEVAGAQLKAPIIVPHAASKAETKYPYEAIFRSLQFALLENACREFLFLKEFFLVEGHASLEMFSQVLGMTLGMLAKNLENYVSDTYDAIGLLLCATVCFKYQQVCHERSIPALDQHWASLQTTIWPRFEYVLRLHIQSVKDFDTSKFGKELRPHYVTRRYAEFSAAVVSMSDFQPNESVSRLLGQLSEEVECLLLRMAAVFPQRKEQLVFLINNLDLILTVHAEHTRDGAREAGSAREEPRREIAGFRDHLSQRSAEYVEECLRPHFGACMQFVKEGEAMTSKGRGDDFKKQETKCMAMAQQFSSCWRGALERLSQEVLSSFPSLVTGSQLLQLVLSTLVTYHHRLHALLPAAAQATLTNKHQLMVEIKKYKTSF